MGDEHPLARYLIGESPYYRATGSEIEEIGRAHV
jgi:hypothetical protein